MGKLAAMGIPVLVSINERQQAAYSRYFAADQLVVDRYDAVGPLGGIVTANEQFPDSDFLVLACDLVDMTLGPLRELMSRYRSQPDADFYAFYGDHFWEPLCGIYTERGLQTVDHPAGSLQQVLSGGRTAKLMMSLPECFRNYNRDRPASE